MDSRYDWSAVTRRRPLSEPGLAVAATILLSLASVKRGYVGKSPEACAVIDFECTDEINVCPFLLRLR